MKPPPFEYVAPHSLDEVVDALQRSDGDAKLLAGGQSLLPLLNMRLATPGWIVDLGRARELAYIRHDHDGVAFGAMARASAVEHDAIVRARVPLLAEALSWVGHSQIRNRGTVVGSIAHADPAAELPAVALCLDARLTVQGPKGTRHISPGDLFVGYLTTTLEPDEVLTEAWVPFARERTGQVWLEFARRHGDFALAGVAVSMTLSEDGAIDEVRLALAGVGGTAIRPRDAEAVLTGGALDDERISEAVELMRKQIDPETDVHGSADYRRHLAGVLLERALRKAHERAHATLSGGDSALDVRRSLEQMNTYA